MNYVGGCASPGTYEEILEELTKDGPEVSLVPCPLPAKYSPALLMFVVLLIMLILAGVFIVGIECQMVVWVQHQVMSLRS
jgi:hypothetical protein